MCSEQAAIQIRDAVSWFGLVWFGLVQFGDFFVFYREPPLPHEPGLACCELGFRLLLQEERLSGDSLLLLLFLCSYITSKGWHEPAESGRAIPALPRGPVFIYSNSASQPPPKKTTRFPDIKTKQNSWVSFYALGDLRCQPARCQALRVCFSKRKPKSPVRPRILLGVFSEHSPSFQDLESCISPLVSSLFKSDLHLCEITSPSQLSPHTYPAILGVRQKTSIKCPHSQGKLRYQSFSPRKGKLKCVGKIKLSEKGREKNPPSLNPQQPPWKEVI